MLPHTLYGKLVVVLVPLFLLIAVLFAVAMQFSSERYHHEVSQKLQRNLAETIISHNEFLTEDQLDSSAVHRVFKQAMAINPGIEIYLLDLQGNILSYSAPAGKIKRKSISMDSLKRFVANPGRLPIYGDDPRDLERMKIFSAAPILRQDIPLGYLYVILGGEEHDNVLQMLRASHNLRLTLWLLIAALVFGLVAALFSFALLTRRLRKLVSTMGLFEKSGFSARPNMSVSTRRRKTGDEIDRLAVGFSEMADRIIAQVGKLKDAEKSLRELSTNISHDLRTPLATLGGYVDTVLLKDKDLTAEQRTEYLQIASTHCNRLGRLIDELFELGKLDSAATAINQETLDLGDLVSDIAMKFQLRAEQSGIEIATVIPNDLPHIYADIGLIERAFDNLIDNAMRHTPKRGRIVLALETTHDGLVVSVKDTGIGISEQDILHIFDRFYQSDHRQKEHSNQGGLGLAITKRIIELHGGEISVTSIPGKGTRFTIQFPVT